MQLSLLSNYTIIESRFRLLFSLSRSTFGCPLQCPLEERRKKERSKKERKKGEEEGEEFSFFSPYVSVTWVSVEWILRDGRDWTRRPPRPKATTPMLFVEGTSKSR